MTPTLNEDFELVDTGNFTSSKDNSLTSEATSSPFASDIVYELAASGNADAHTEERTLTAAGRDYPCLYTTMTLAGIPASQSLTCIGQGNRVMCLSYTSPGDGNFEELLSLVTYDK